MPLENQGFQAPEHQCQTHRFFAQYMSRGSAVANNPIVSLEGLTSSQLPIKAVVRQARQMERFPDTGRLPDDPLSTLGVTTAKVQQLRELCAGLQGATVNLGNKYLELVDFLRTNPVTEMTGRDLMFKAGLSRQRISEVYRVVRAPELVLEAFRNRLIGFKAALQVARLKDGPKLSEPDNHKAIDRALFKAWTRFVKEWGSLLAQDLPHACYLNEPPNGLFTQVPIKIGDEKLKIGGSLRFQFGRFNILLYRFVESEQEAKEFRAWCEQKAAGVPVPDLLASSGRLRKLRSMHRKKKPVGEAVVAGCPR